MKPSESILSPLGLTLPDCEDESSHWSLSDLERIVRAMLADKDTRALPPSFFASVCSSDEDQEDMKCALCGQPYHHNGGNCPKRLGLAVHPKSFQATFADPPMDTVASSEDDEAAEWLDSNDGRLFMGASPAATSSPSGDKPSYPAVCPCTLVGPCEPHCTCADPLKSGGCRRCASYGSAEQRLGMAQWIADALKERDTLRARVANAEQGKVDYMDLAATRGVALDAAQARIAQLEAETMTLKEENARLSAELAQCKTELGRRWQLLKDGDEWRAEAERAIADRNVVIEALRGSEQSWMAAADSMGVELRKREAELAVIKESVGEVIGQLKGADCPTNLPESEGCPICNAQAALQSAIDPACIEEALSATDRTEGEQPEPIEVLIARSSLGDEESVAIRAQADPAVVARVLARADELSRQQPEPPSPPELPDSSAQAPREIKVGSVWKQCMPPGMHLRVVTSDDYGIEFRLHAGQSFDSCTVSEFRLWFTHVSDPPEATREIKVGSRWAFQGDPEAVDTVVALENTTHVKIRLGKGFVLNQNKEKFREEHTWLSDPPEAEEPKP